MDEQVSECPPRDAGLWLARQEGLPESEAERCRGQVGREIATLAKELALVVCSHPADEERLASYVGRLWRCMEYHWRQFASKQPVGLRDTIQRLTAGELGHGTTGQNVLLEVTLAQALELGDPKAAEMFEQEYMPTVRAVARHIGGLRALDAVDNFAAELILPRQDRPPKIATYQGRTHLKSWLRSVVVNYWTSSLRKRQPISLDETMEHGVQNDPHEQSDRGHCQELLTPLFQSAVQALRVEDRVLVKMLVLDGAPQHELAHSMGVHSGTLTRRRQSAASSVFQTIRDRSQAHSRRATECLELVLAGDDVTLRSRLAQVLAETVSGPTGVDGG